MQIYLNCGKMKARVICLSFIVVLIYNSSNGATPNDLNGENITTFTDIDADALYLILNCLKLNDLVNTAVAIPQLTAVASEVFRRKYQRSALKVGIRNDYLCESTDDDGSQKMTIYYNAITGPHVTTLNQFVNDYCSSSLKELVIVSREDIVLDQFMVPCKAVEDLTWTIKSNNSIGSKPWSEIFPNLRRLSFNLNGNINVSFIDGEFSILENFKFMVPVANIDKYLKHFEGFIKKNPTIQSIEMDKSHKWLIDVMNKYLPKLENFTLGQYRRIPFQLDHVKNFVYHSKTADYIYDISMPRLESLSMRVVLVEENDCNAWILFFKKHPNLRRLHFKEIKTLFQSRERRYVEPTLNKMVANLSKLVEADLECINQFLIYDIIQFIRNHANLQKLRFTFNHFSEGYQRQYFEFANESNMKGIRTEYDDGKIGFVFENITTSI